MRLWIAALFALLTLLAWAEPGRAQLWERLERDQPEEIASGQTDFWVRTLGLTSDQAATIQQMNVRYAASSSLAVKTAAGDEQKHTALRAIEAQKSQEMLAVLTPDQRDRYLAIVQRLNQIVDAAPR